MYKMNGMNKIKLLSAISAIAILSGCSSDSSEDKIEVQSNVVTSVNTTEIATEENTTVAESLVTSIVEEQIDITEVVSNSDTAEELVTSNSDNYTEIVNVTEVINVTETNEDGDVIEVTSVDESGNAINVTEVVDVTDAEGQVVTEIKSVNVTNSNEGEPSNSFKEFKVKSSVRDSLLANIEYIGSGYDEVTGSFVYISHTSNNLSLYMFIDEELNPGSTIKTIYNTPLYINASSSNILEDTEESITDFNIYFYNIEGEIIAECLLSAEIKINDDQYWYCAQDGVEFYDENVKEEYEEYISEENRDYWDYLTFEIINNKISEGKSWSSVSKELHTFLE